MWIPNDSAEIEAAAARGDLTETAGFDAKADLPHSKKQNVTLAIDVAAMSTGGGVLLYGIGEDGNGEPTILQPIALANARERIDSIVGTSLAEVPYIEVHPYPTEDDRSLGYIAVVVPASPRAPHQVIVRDELRFYGRGATGNRKLLEGEIARLYERRRLWEVNRDERLIEAVNGVPFKMQGGTGYTYAFAQPVPPDQALWDRATAASEGGEGGLLHALAQSAKRPERTGAHLNGNPWWERVGADVWRLSSAHEPAKGDKPTAYLMAVDLNIDGRGVLFAGASAVTGPIGGAEGMVVFEQAIASNFAAFLAIMASLFKAAGYYGPVDIGLYLAGIDGAVSAARLSNGDVMFHDDLPRFSANTYSRTLRLAAAAELDDPEQVTRSVLRRFVEATTQLSNHDPFGR